MYWRCSCGEKNPENARACGKCGAKTDAPRKFYTGTIFGSGLIFLMIYYIGTSIGGTLVAFSLEPTDEAILANFNAQGDKADNLSQVPLSAQKEAKTKAVEKARGEMSIVVHSILLWIVPFFLFPLIGLTVGFVSAGRTVIEAAIGSVIGQALGFTGMYFSRTVSIHWIELIIGLILGFAFAGAGAYIGEAIQEKRERATLEAQDEELV